MNMKRLIVLTVVLALIVGMQVPALASGVDAVVTGSELKVYSLDAPYAQIGTLSKGTELTVTKYRGNVALIEYNGYTGMADLRLLGRASEPSNDNGGDAPVATTTMYAGRNTRLYKSASASARYATVKAGTQVERVAVNGSVAKVIVGGQTGYMVAAHLSETKPEDTTPTQTYDDVPVVTTASARVYASPSTSSASASVPKGTAMTLTAIKGSCAQVKLGGKTCYIAASVLQKASDDAGDDVGDDDNGGSSGGDINFDGSNEQVTYLFLTQVMGYNTAAACGVMASFKYESGYKPTSVNSSGTSYGIAQWTGTRKTRLINWCGDNGYDYTTLKGQLYFLQYELERYYPAVDKALRQVDNTAQGAYDAGYKFCYDFEAPSSRASRSDTRGNYAKTTLWDRYKV